jgi:hypothetical protein
MKKVLSLLSLLLFVSLVFTSCKKEEEVTLTAEDLTYNYVGCNNGPLAMGKVNATSTKGAITYSLVSQSFNTVLVINASTGEISLRDASAYTQVLNAYSGSTALRKITAVVAVSNGTETKNVNVTINIAYC